MNIMEKVIKALDENNLNFNAHMVETYACIDGVFQPTGKFTPVRDDKVGKDSIIDGSSFSTRFVPIQNRDAFNIIGDLANVSDVDFINVGSWGNGAGVFAQVSLGNSMVIGNNGDTIGKYLSFVNAHDGSRAMSVLITPYRFFCKNQISMAIRDAQKKGNILNIRHDAKGEERIKEVVNLVDKADRIFKLSEDQYMQLADTRVNMDQVKEAMARMLPWNGYMEGRGATTYANKVSAMIDRFNNADDGLTERMTGWNLYNAIQGTFQHDSKHTSTYNKSLLLGSIASKSREALVTVQDVCYASPLTKTEHKEFDALFAKVA